MPTDTGTLATLAALAKCWLVGELDAGPVLHDLLEQEGWPWGWYRVEYDWHLRLPNMISPLAVVRYPRAWANQRCERWRCSLQGIHRRRLPHYGSASAAKLAAEAALRRALRGD